MKWLHLADLHIGKTVNGYSMLEDQEYILEQITQMIRERRPDAVLIAGDVYDKPVPGAGAVKLFDRFLTELSQLGVTVIIIGGNHDSPERLAFAGGILQDRGVHLSGGYDGVLHKVALEDAYGPVQFYLLPFLRASAVRRYGSDTQIEQDHDAVCFVLDRAGIDWSGRNVLVAHQFVTATGWEVQRSDSEIGPVGGVDSIDVSILAPFDYVALGHLHGPQRIGYDHVRYGGSPLKYSFSEVHHKKTVPFVELREKGNLEITLLPLTPRRDLRRIKGPIVELLSKEACAQGNAEDYLHITLTDEEEMLDAIGRVRRVYPHVMTLAFENARTRAAIGPAETPLEAEADPLELFAAFFQRQNGAELTEAQMGIVKALLVEEEGS